MTKKNKRPSFRLRFPFWLDMHKPDEADLAEKIAILKADRVFVKTIRDGIRLIWDLKAGRLEILFSLFPWVKEEFEKRANNQAIVALQTQLARLEKLMGQGMSVPVDIQSGVIQPKIPSGPKPLLVPSLALPRFEDDDEPTLILSKSASTDASYNLINSLKGLN